MVYFKIFLHKFNKSDKRCVYVCVRENQKVVHFFTSVSLKLNPVYAFSIRIDIREKVVCV